MLTGYRSTVFGIRPPVVANLLINYAGYMIVNECVARDAGRYRHSWFSTNILRLGGLLYVKPKSQGDPMNTRSLLAYVVGMAQIVWFA